MTGEQKKFSGTSEHNGRAANGNLLPTQKKGGRAAPVADRQLLAGRSKTFSA
jgi:hypothetical protein